VHIYILGPKLLRWNFLQISELSVRSGAHKLFRRFLDFSKILTAIRENCGASDENENCILHLKEQSIMKNLWKPHRNRPINGNAMLVRTMHPSNAQCSGFGAWQKICKHHVSLLQPARVVWSSPNFAWWYSSSCPSNRCHSLFDPTHSFSYRAHGKIRPNWPTRGCSVIIP